MNASHDKYYDPYRWDGNEENSVAVRNRKRKIGDSNSKSLTSAASWDSILRGREYPIHRNDVLARSIEEGKHLINYFDDRLAFNSTAVSDTKSCNIDEEEENWCDIVHDSNDFDRRPQNKTCAPRKLLLDRSWLCPSWPSLVKAEP